MAATFSPVRRAWMPVAFFGLLFLLFFQLVSEFIEIIYTFGLLGVEIPPEIAMVALFFTPLLLLALPGGFPARAVMPLAALTGVMRAAAVMLPPEATLIVRGIGTGLLFLLLPALFANLRQWEKDAASAGLEMGAGLALALAGSILLRELGAGSDLSLLRPWLAVVLAVGLAAAAWGMALRQAQGGAPQRTGGHYNPVGMGPPLREAPLRKAHVVPTSYREGAGTRVVLALCIGWLSTLAVMYFALVSPGVMARWTGADGRLVVLVFCAALAIYAAALATGRLGWLTPARLVGWNWLFLLAGVLAIQLSATIFPVDAGGFPLVQADASLWRQIPLYAMLLLAPVVLHNMQVLSREMIQRAPGPRALAGGFALAALLFLIYVFAQVFTTVYDYMPVVGPPMRDRFWLAFLLPGLGMIFPLMLLRQSFDRLTSSRRPTEGALRVGRDRPFDRLHPLYFPLVLALLVGAVLVSVLTGRVTAQIREEAGLRVVTYNLQQGYDNNGGRAYEEQMRAIRMLDADIVGLQESDTARFSGGNADLVRTIAQGLGMHAYYGPRTVTGTFGIALLSRYPLENARTFFMYSEGEQTAAIEAELRVGEKSYHILVTHLGNGGPMIQQQQVLERLAGQENVIAMGDFNFPPDTPQYALTTEQWADAFVLAGELATPGLDPARRIDHMFVSPGMGVLSAEYIASPVSDHPGLVVEIEP